MGTPTSQDKLRKIIEQEIRAIAPRIIKEVMTQVMGQMIAEAAVTNSYDAPPMRNNSNKRKALQEVVDDYDDDYTMVEDPPVRTSRQPRSRAEIAEEMGYGEFVNPRSVGRRQDLISVDAQITENGNVVPIDPRRVPEPVLKAMNKDYTNFMNELNRRSNGGF